MNWVDGLVRPFVPTAYRPETYLPFGLPGSGLIVAVVALTLLGFLAANLIGRTLVDLGERLLGRMPVVRAIYRGLKQVFETLFSGKGSSFRRVGLVEFPSPGMWSIVLISQAPSVNIAANLPGQEEHISVFLPCAPNPTTGFFFYVPKSKIIEVDMSDRGRRDADHVRRRGAARLRPAERRSPRWPAWRTRRGSRIRPRAAAGAGEGEGGARCCHSGAREDANPESRDSGSGATHASRNDSEKSTPRRSAAWLHRARTDTAGTAAPRRARPSASDCPS